MVYCSVLVYVLCVRVVCCSALLRVAVHDARDGAAGLRLAATATKTHIPRHTNTHAPIQTPPACACVRVRLRVCVRVSVCMHVRVRVRAQVRVSVPMIVPVPVPPSVLGSVGVSASVSGE